MHVRPFRLPSEAVALGLEAEGVAVVDGFLGAERALANRAEVAALFRRGGFRAARVGTGARRRLAPEVRRDEVCWLDESAQETAPGVAPPPASVRAFLDVVHALRVELSRRLFLGLERVECHAARYAPGAFYRAHLDTFVGDASRRVSFVYFLNPGWRERDGGCLRIHGEKPCDIWPVLDRLVVFLSGEVLHEVRRTRRVR